MDFQSIIDHMNSDHQSSLIGLVKKYAKQADVQDVQMTGVDLEGMTIVYGGGQSIRIPFEKACTHRDELKGAIIALCRGVSQGVDTQAIKQEIEDFKASLASVMIASVDSHGKAVSSYAPTIQLDNKVYIYISEVAEHYHSIKSHPDNVEILFIEDESKSKTIIARTRLKHKITARFVERGTEEFEAALDHLEASMQGGGGIKTIRQMQDFHLVELQLLDGRYVKGFGQAYNITPQGAITHVGGAGGMPHRPHK